jgi:cytochrome d ubiquinol oxidase subunit I
MDLFAARSQMAISLAFHILFAVAGMAMPLLMAIAEWRHMRTGDPVYASLARRWAKGTAILFAVGAVSGTVLSFELGLLWPRFMELAGPLIGIPFSLEGFAFFTEAIFLGLFMYGWDRLSPRMHLFSGVMVAASGLASGVFVVAVNAWMNAPVGFELGPDGSIARFDVWAAFGSPAFPTQALHMALAAYSSVAIVVLGIHAWALRRQPESRFHLSAAKIALGVAIVAVPLQIVSGDFAAKHIAEHQPMKLAAAEGLYETTARAPLAIGGWPDSEARELRYAIEVPAMLSVLATGSPDGVVLGLEEVPESEWPPVPVVHVSFQIMVALGFAMLALVGWGAWIWWRRRELARERAFLRVATWLAPSGLIALEAGWFVTEVGRQPWTIHGVMKTRDAVTTVPHLDIPLWIGLAVYALLGTVTAVLLYRYVVSVPPDAEGAP